MLRQTETTRFTVATDEKEVGALEKVLQPQINMCSGDKGVSEIRPTQSIKIKAARQFLTKYGRKVLPFLNSSGAPENSSGGGD